MSSTSGHKVSFSNPAVPEELIDVLRQLHRPLIIAHVVPDADALGAMLAMARAWASKHCRPKVSLPAGSLSQRHSFLFDLAEVQVAALEDFAAADGFVVLDTAKKDRCNIEPGLKQTDWSVGRPIVNIDHHETNTGFGDVNWVVDRAGSTSELVYCLLQAADQPINAVTASLLYAGIQTDTIGFSLATTSASSLAAAAGLVTLGADVAELGERLCRSQHKSEFDLLQIVYANTKLRANGQLAYSSASFEEIHEIGCSAADIDDQINIPRSLCGVRLAMLFTEGDRGKTRINFRSSDDVTVVDLAREFDGGGHRQAAGAVLDCGLEKAIQTVVPRAVDHLKKFPR